MLLHKKRIVGNLNGIGYINPFAIEKQPDIIQPLSHEDYLKYLRVESTPANEYKMISDKETFLNEMGSIEAPVVDPTQPIKITEQMGGAAAPGDLPNTTGISDWNTSGKLATTITGTKMLYDALKALGDNWSTKYGIAARNYYGKNINPHPNWRPDFVGENHLPHPTGVTYNYLGPGTKIWERIARNDPPLDGSYGIDAQARKHDIDYAHAKNLDDVRQADQKFIKNVEQSTAPYWQRKLISSGMKAKIKAEDYGILDPNKYSKIANIQDTAMRGGKLKATKKFGKYPDSAIRQKLIKKYKQQSQNLDKILTSTM